MRRRVGPGLAHARIEAEVADQLARALGSGRCRRSPRGTSPRRSRSRPGTVISRLTCAELERVAGDRRSTAATSASRNSIWRRQPSTVSRSSARQLELAPASAGPLTPNRSLTGGRPISRRISTAWISFFARVRALTSWPRRASRRRIARVCSSGIQTASSDPAASSFASVRASSRSVFARAWRMPVSRGLHDHHPRDVRLDDPRDLPRVAGHLQRHPIARAEALREQLQRLRRRLDPARRADLAGLDDRDLAEVAMHVQPDRPHHRAPPSLARQTGDRWANDTDGFALAAQPGQSQGRPPKSRARSPSSQEPACPACVLPESPCPGHPTLTAEPGQQPHERQFHAPTSSSHEGWSRAPASREIRGTSPARGSPGVRWRNAPSREPAAPAGRSATISRLMSTRSAMGSLCASLPLPLPRRPGGCKRGTRLAARG